ncbi:MAG: DUF501 domain-containing protein [Myxococcales bacterium]|nr:DUF501 domain-containing protein [Myxococcales bacterium]
MSDPEAIRAQIGRPLRGEVVGMAHCALGLPRVARVPPLLETGEPFPTRYWLCCPLARRRVSRLEAEGGVREAERRLAEDPELEARMARAHRDYAVERDAGVPAEAELRPRGGVAGLEAGVKCLHAHLAHHLAGGDNPIGAETAARIQPLECERSCVLPAEAASSSPARRDPAWREPPLPEPGPL